MIITVNKIDNDSRCIARRLQLYNLSPDPERKEFLDKLFNYMQSKGELSDLVFTLVWKAKLCEWPVFINTTIALIMASHNKVILSFTVTQVHHFHPPTPRHWLGWWAGVGRQC